MQMKEDGTLLHFIFSPFNMEFGFGVALGYLYLYRQKFLIIRFTLLPILAVILLTRIASTEFLPENMNGTLTFFHVALLAPACIIIISFALWIDPKVLNKPMIFFGDASYSIFLFHPLVISPLDALLKVYCPLTSPEIVVLLTGCCGVLLGCIVHLYVELPLVKILGNTILARDTSLRVSG